MTNVNYSPAAWFKCTLGIDCTSEKVVLLFVYAQPPSFQLTWDQSTTSSSIIKTCSLALVLALSHSIEIQQKEKKETRDHPRHEKSEV